MRKPRTRRAKIEYDDSPFMQCGNSLIELKDGMKFVNGIGFILTIYRVYETESTRRIRYSIDKNYELVFYTKDITYFKSKFRNLYYKDIPHKSKYWMPILN